ncbi:ATP-binding protein [Rubneribacter sp.]|nr:putative DNA binding domain-containing protein [Candidatus Rubneribacter avistercoris]
MHRETAVLEYKSEITRTFLETVSAFANYTTGAIVFGIADNGEIVGLRGNLIDECLRIETLINDSIEPIPRFELKPDPANKTISLIVYDSPDKPYLYHGKAFWRADAATVEVPRIEYRRLVLAGNGQSLDGIKSPDQDLSFELLSRELHDKLGVDNLDLNVLRSLDLAAKDGTFNNAALWVADRNSAPGVDIAKFGSSIDQILDHETVVGESVLRQHEAALRMFDRYYSYELVDGITRETHYLLPRDAFREAVANALVHRTWDVPADILIRFFENRIEITSPGGLPPDITEDEYLRGMLSSPRNPILANLFFRLGYIEKMGTGILRIRSLYEPTGAAPEFNVGKGSVQVILPVPSRASITLEQKAILSAMPKGVALPRAEIERLAHTGRDVTLRLLSELERMNLVRKEGRGRSTRYVKL